MRNRKSETGNEKFFILASYFLLLTSCFMMFFTSEVKGTTVGEIEINGLYSIEKEEFLDILDIKPDKQIDKEAVRLGIKRAFLKGLFENISIKTTGGEKVKVTINVMERDFIEKIYIKGDYDLSKKFIKNNFSLKEEQVMRYDLLKVAIEKLKNEIAMRGFPHSSVNAEIKKINKPSRVTLYLHINTGEPERIKKMFIFGPAEEVKSIMKLSEGDIYDKEKLSKDLNRLKAYYKKKGYFKPVVGPYTFTEGTLTISVNPGKRLTISLEGNSAVSTKALLKEMPFFEVEDLRDDIVEEAVHRMRSLYYKEGYPFTQITPVMTSEGELVNLHFSISEGIEIRLGSITFSGISLPEKNLKEVMSLKEGGLYNPDLIDIDREAIQELYNALGYLSSHVEEFQTKYEESSHKIDIVIRVNEGLKTEIEEINVVGTNLVSEEEIKKVLKIKPGDPYNEVDISDIRYGIINLYSSRGFSDVVVSVERAIDTEKASITFKILEGDEISFGKTIITGNFATRYEVVKRELQYHEDTPFNYHLLSKARQGLYKLGLFSDVDIEVLDRYDHKKDVLIKLNEGNAGAVEFGLGYGDYERFRGFFDLSYRNLWGMNRQSSFRFEMSSLEKRYIFQYLDPWFFDVPLPFRTFFLYEDKKEINIDTRETRYRLKRYGASAGLEKKLSDSLKTELYYELSLVKTFDVKPDVILSKEDIGTLIISGIKPGIIYDTRDNPFDPKKGILSGFSLKFTSPLFFSETNFLKLIFHGSTYHELTKRIVLALSLRGGVAHGYHDTEELPIVERFFLGGRTTVRGYSQDMLGPKGSNGDPTGGNAFLCGNVEIRSSFGKGIGIVAFLDGGNVWLKAKDMDPANLKYTAGLGLRYNTPVGPIRIDYGHKLQRENGESSGELHFSIGHAF
ncbi:MAG: outer membrane protein assembly factor BamA [Nitrospirota bacterium]|nr:outer membrane protein assembly factor BamA [Nitrospirota bacterium]MDH5767618.1 outer membrane protein assembly factor BamA [Nitrospirota bacterium]